MTASKKHSTTAAATNSTPSHQQDSNYKTLLNEKLQQLQLKNKAKSRYMQEFQKVAPLDSQQVQQLYLSYRDHQEQAELKNRQFDTLQDEYFKLKKQKDQLEVLCRALNEKQKEREEHQAKLMQEQDKKRQQLSDHFQKSIENINEKFSEHEKQIIAQSTTIDSLKQENERLVKQMEIKDKQLGTLEKKSELENKLFESQNHEHLALLEKYNERNQTLEQQTKILHAKNEELNKQIKKYADSFGSIQQSMQESTKVFEGFKKDQQSLQKTINKLQKEKRDMATKSQKSDLKLLELYELTQQQSDVINKLTKRNGTLETLCRALQEKLSQGGKAVKGEESGNDNAAETTSEKEQDEVAEESSTSNGSS